MNGFLLDTNVPSELTNPKANPKVETWLDEADDERLFLSVISLGEMFKGLTLLPDGKRRSQIEAWLRIRCEVGSRAAFYPSPKQSTNIGASSRVSASGSAGR